MKKILLLLWAFILCQTIHLSAQNITSETLRPFEGQFYCEDTGVHIHLNLYEENVDIPNFSFLGQTHGYMNGNIYGTWMLVKHEIKQNKAILRFTNDIGSDTQVVEFTLNPDHTYTYETIHGNSIRKAVGRKLVKTTGHMIFRRK